MNKNFEQYMNEQIPNWKNDLAVDTIEYLKNLHKNVIDWKKVADNIFNMSFNQNKAGIDYSTDFEKANQNLVASEMELEQAINNIKKVINPNFQMEEQTNKTI